MSHERIVANPRMSDPTVVKLGITDKLATVRSERSLFRAVSETACDPRGMTQAAAAVSRYAGRESPLAFIWFHDIGARPVSSSTIVMQPATGQTK